MRHPKTLRFRKYIKPHVSGKTVLDIGAVDHDASKRNVAPWIHEFLVDAASEVVGIDILEEEVDVLRNDGYNILCEDAQDFDLDRTFEIVFLGETIEHLVNFDGLLTSVKRHLEPSGKLIITTPNCLSIYHFGHRVLGYEINQEHTCWFDAQTLAQLLARYGLEPIETNYARVSTPGLNPVAVIGYLAETVFPDHIAKGRIVMVAKRSDDITV